jgi:hypothetical protein
MTLPQLRHLAAKVINQGNSQDLKSLLLKYQAVDDRGKPRLKQLDRSFYEVFAGELQNLVKEEPVPAIREPKMTDSRLVTVKLSYNLYSGNHFINFWDGEDCLGSVKISEGEANGVSKYLNIQITQ